MTKKQTRQTGNQAENLAETYLKNKNYRILGRNLFFRYGEIDILAQDKKDLVVVEVKYKHDDSLGTAEEMITHRKKRKLIILAKYLSEQYSNENVRIDVVAINGERINHIINAVEENES